MDFLDPATPPPPERSLLDPEVDPRPNSGALRASIPDATEEESAPTDPEGGRKKRKSSRLALDPSATAMGMQTEEEEGGRWRKEEEEEEEKGDGMEGGCKGQG